MGTQLPGLLLDSFNYFRSSHSVNDFFSLAKINHFPSTAIICVGKFHEKSSNPKAAAISNR